MLTSSGKTTIKRSVFRGNSVSGSQTQGGAVSMLSNYDVHLSGCTFDRNAVYGDGSSGGAVSLAGGSFGAFVVDTSVFTANSAPGLGVTGAGTTYGGALSVSQVFNVVLDGLTFADNSANGLAGAVYLYSCTKAVVSSAQFTNNSALNGGGVVVEESGGVAAVQSDGVTMRNISLTRNHAKNGGGEDRS
jgi:hypothetical protein